MCADVAIPEKPKMANDIKDRSALNLYLENEKTRKNRLGHSVFNLYDKPEFPEEKEFDQNPDRSILSIYLKEE
jgi:hypothetical protein